MEPHDVHSSLPDRCRDFDVFGERISQAIIATDVRLYRFTRFRVTR